MRAAYVFSVAFSIPAADATLTPNRFETTLRLHAPEPGEETEHIDWRFFQTRLWNGSVSDEVPLRRAAGEWLGVEVETISFKELRTDQEYREALETAVAEDLPRFNAESADEAVGQHLGSSMHVVPTEEV